MQVHIEPSEPSVRGGEHLMLAAVVDTGAGPYSFRWNCVCPGLSVGDTYGGSLNVTVPLRRLRPRDRFARGGRHRGHGHCLSRPARTPPLLGSAEHCSARGAQAYRDKSGLVRRRNRVAVDQIADGVRRVEHTAPPVEQSPGVRVLPNLRADAARQVGQRTPGLAVGAVHHRGRADPQLSAAGT